nr:MAG TPA: hypothetical protein [Caudoviricetes sp.]
MSRRSFTHAGRLEYQACQEEQERPFECGFMTEKGILSWKGQGKKLQIG